jgi:protoheme IX farnesyltransferase
MKIPGNSFKDYLELGKLKVMAPVSLTGFTGYFIFSPHLSSGLFLVTAGILLMAISASVLNQIQEADLDARMNRTRNRPIPAGRITRRRAAVYTLSTLACGIFLIYFQGNLKAVVIGLITIGVYNGIYTPLKRITPFAVLPGALTGALPPMMGWVAAGGGVWDKPIVFIGFLMFMGQIPHFWLLVVRYGEEYKSAGLPSLTGIFSSFQIKRLTFTWVLTSVAAALFLCLFKIIQINLITVVLLAASIYLVWRFTDLLKDQEMYGNITKYSVLLNCYFLLIMILLISDRIITRG